VQLDRRKGRLDEEGSVMVQDFLAWEKKVGMLEVQVHCDE